MKKTFNYNLKNRFKTSILLSALSIGTLISGVSCTPPQRRVNTTKKTESIIKIDRKELDSLYNDIVITALDIATYDDTDKKLRIILGEVLIGETSDYVKTESEKYSAISNLSDSLSNIKVEQDFLVYDLIKKCNQYTYIVDRIREENQKNLTNLNVKSR